MPLQSGSSQETVSANIEKLMREYKRTGKIGNTRPTSLDHARKIAAAASYNKAGSK